MHLQGWAHPLPAYLVKAIEEGKIQVKQGKDFQFLVGSVVNPEGTLIEFKE